MFKYIKVPYEAFKDGLTPHEALVLSYIKHYLDYMVIFIETNETISKNFNLSSSTVGRIMRKLKREGYIDYAIHTNTHIIIGPIRRKDKRHKIYRERVRVVSVNCKGVKYFK